MSIHHNFSILTRVKLDGPVISSEIYSRVLVATHNGIKYAAKQLLKLKLGFREIPPKGFDSWDEEDRYAEAQQEFLQECDLHSKLHHPNIVKMIGVYYPSRNDAVKVMEMMKYKLTTVLETDIPMYVKLSIIQDISKGVNYLHSLNPPLIHRYLNVHAVLLTASMVAKICGFSGLKEKSKDLVMKSRWGIPDANENTDVFSFGRLVFHVVTQLSLPILWSYEEDMNYAEQYQSWLNQISNESLKQLVVTLFKLKQSPHV